MRECLGCETYARYTHTRTPRVYLMLVLVPRSTVLAWRLRPAAGIPVATMSCTAVCVRGRVFRAFAFRSPRLPRSTCARPLYGILRAALDHVRRRIIHLEHAPRSFAVVGVLPLGELLSNWFTAAPDDSGCRYRRPEFSTRGYTDHSFLLGDSSISRVNAATRNKSIGSNLERRSDLGLNADRFDPRRSSASHLRELSYRAARARLLDIALDKGTKG